MQFVADLHVHSHLSRATSKKADFAHLYEWAQRKGITVVGSGDFTHPQWRQKIGEELVEAEPGLFRLRDDLARAVDERIPAACRAPVRFMLQVEISSIYKWKDRVRKVHNLVFAPDRETVERFSQRLAQIGNIASDGRPILGLDSRDLLEIVLETSTEAFLIPAHIWTPWFSVLGSKSGFQSIEECFRDLSEHIFAVETGLSSDPPMNWRLSKLDRFTLVSNSDAHSPSKLAREANLFDCELSYVDMREAMRTRKGFLGTLEFFPQEGKYHADGHRKCCLRLTPKETLAYGGRCPSCGKKLTVGVLHRVEALADHPDGRRSPAALHFESLIGLDRVLGEIKQRGPQTKGVQKIYRELLSTLGPELAVLRRVPLADVRKKSDALVAEGLRRMRSGEVHIAAGFDGEYGKVRLFGEDERATLCGQKRLFPGFVPVESGAKQRAVFSAQTRKSSSRSTADRNAQATEPPPLDLTPCAPSASVRSADASASGPKTAPHPALVGLTAEQRRAVCCAPGPVCIVAGPGTGKTRVLTCRIAYRIDAGTLDPARCLAVTFTNKAAAQMAERLERLLGRKRSALIKICTFHRLGLDFLSKNASAIGLGDGFELIGRPESESLLQAALPQVPKRQIREALDAISAHKAEGLRTRPGSAAEKSSFTRIAEAHRALLATHNAFDLDDLICHTLWTVQDDPRLLTELKSRFTAVFIDEYQDVNPAQERLVDLLCAADAPERADVTVIGDADQSIYSFRGADAAALQRFLQKHPQGTSVRLRQSFRTPDLILQAAHRLVARSPHRPQQTSRLVSVLSEKPDRSEAPTRVWSNITHVGAIPVYTTATEKAEAEFVVATIERLIGGTGFFSIDSGRACGAQDSEVDSLSDIVVLVRLRAQLPALEEAFFRSSLPYETATADRCLDPAAALTVAALRLVLRRNSRLARFAFLRTAAATLNAQAANGETKSGRRQSFSLQQLWAWAALPDFDAGLPAVFSPFVDALPAIAQTVGSGENGGAATGSAPGRGGRVMRAVEVCLKRFCLQCGQQAQARRARTQLGGPAVAAGDDLCGFVFRTDLRGGQDLFDPRAERVHLMTLHAAKGLEFPFVFMVGLNDGILPYRHRADVEEERRLFYVGMTRASTRLFFSFSKKRWLFGERLPETVSPFVAELGTTLCEQMTSALPKTKNRDSGQTQLSLF